MFLNRTFLKQLRTGRESRWSVLIRGWERIFNVPLLFLPYSLILNCYVHFVCYYCSPLNSLVLFLFGAKDNIHLVSTIVIMFCPLSQDISDSDQKIARTFQFLRKKPQESFLQKFNLEKIPRKDAQWSLKSERRDHEQRLAIKGIAQF